MGFLALSDTEPLRKGLRAPETVTTSQRTFAGKPGNLRHTFSYGNDAIV